jgi:hypothetical protein
MSTYDSDRAAILKLHTDWRTANGGLDIPLMQTVFPAGDAYLMFNLNGHPYFGIEEKTTLWEYYQTRLATKMSRVRIMRLDIGVDMAYIASEGVFPSNIRELDETGEPVDGADHELTAANDVLIRTTEIYKRDDGLGNPVWKMWHYHCSPLPAPDAPRPAFGDTIDSRGLGQVPGQETFSVTAL